MSNIRVTLKNGTNHVIPSQNIGNIRRILGQKIESEVEVDDKGNEITSPKYVAPVAYTPVKINRTNLEKVAKDLKIHHMQIKSLSDQELLERIKLGK